MVDEVTALQNNKTWTLVDLPTRNKIVGSRWVYVVKLKANGSLDRFKARLVAKGHSQTQRLYYTDTFSPVAKMNSVRILISLAANFDWSLHQLDVTNAFLHEDLQEQVYMQQPLGFVAERETYKVCLLHKSIYGPKQSPRAWFEKQSTTLVEFLIIQSL